jgi:hypothetical protein
MALTDPGTGRYIMASGRAPEPGKVTLAEACKAGDILGYSSGWKRALATTGTAIQGKVVALKDGAIGDEIPVSPDAVIGNYSGGTAGGAVYVAEGTSNGQVTETAPTTTGDCNKIIGYSLSATVIQFCVMARPDSLAS